VLVTSLNLDLGRWVWWPGKLYRQSVPEPEQLEEQPSAVP
jgi:RND superfamily putative drug exporter